VFAGGAAGDEELCLGGVPDEGADDGGGGHGEGGVISIQYSVISGWGASRGAMTGTLGGMAGGELTGTLGEA
jgi:hypothetical protein